MQKKVLFTSVCRPIGPSVGDAPSVGYELLFGQVTRAQGIFSPRAVHQNFSLDYIAENVSAPAVVLQYPSKKELIRELKKGYDFVAITFIMALFHHMKEAVDIVRQYSPKSKIVLGGYGTILSDEVLMPYTDYVCREEGVGFFRKLLNEPEIPLPYRHPLVVSKMKVFSVPTSKTGMIFAGLGCQNGCDFCCTTHFFKRNHIKLLPTGRDIYDVIQRYLEIDPAMQFVVLDEDFLLNKKRALELRDEVLKGGREISLFVFSSIKAISQYTVQEILEMGIDGFWIGYEAAKSGYAKQQGRSAPEIFKEFRENGITILASMVIGFDYQDQKIIEEEFGELMKLKPTLGQFLIYGPTPGTPFYERIIRENRLREDLANNTEKYYKSCDGFSAMVKHPVLPSGEIERMQRWCFDQDFQRLGPSIYRSLETWFMGYKTHKDSNAPFLRKKAESFRSEIRKAYPVFLAGRIFGPNPQIRSWIRKLEKEIHCEIGSPSIKERIMSLLAVVSAFWTWFTLKLKIFQHPSLVRNVYRFSHPGLFAHHGWKAFKKDGTEAELSVKIERNPRLQVIWIRLEGVMDSFSAEELCVKIKHSLGQKKEKLILDFKKLKSFEGRSTQVICERLKKYKSRIHLVPPQDQAISLPDWMRLSRTFNPTSH